MPQGAPHSLFFLGRSKGPRRGAHPYERPERRITNSYVSRRLLHPFPGELEGRTRRPLREKDLLEDAPNLQ